MPILKVDWDTLQLRVPPLMQAASKNNSTMLSQRVIFVSAAVGKSAIVYLTFFE